VARRCRAERIAGLVHAAAGALGLVERDVGARDELVQRFVAGHLDDSAEDVTHTRARLSSDLDLASVWQRLGDLRLRRVEVFTMTRSEFDEWKRSAGRREAHQGVRLSRGLRVTADHDLEALIDELPHDDPWRAKLRVLEPLSAYATTYRHPSPTGKRKGGPSADEVLGWVRTISGLNVEARTSALKPSAPPAR
jgi:hypothetical protein